MSSPCTCLKVKPSSTSSSISLAIVIGLQEIYSNLNAYCFFRSAKYLMTFGCNPSRGGSIITSPTFWIFSLSSGNLVSIFSAGEATKKDFSCKPLILALYSASTIAASTISTQISSFPIPILKKESPILPAPQYRSKIFPSIAPKSLSPVQKSFWAPSVLVWKNEEGEILNFNDVCSWFAASELENWEKSKIS